MSPLSQFGAEHPNGVRVYESDGTFSVSQHQCWLPGIYATEQAAVEAVALTDAQLWGMSHIWRVDGENRPATSEDIARARGETT